MKLMLMFNKQWFYPEDVAGLQEWIFMKNTDGKVQLKIKFWDNKQSSTAIQDNFS